MDCLERTPRQLASEWTDLRRSSTGRLPRALVDAIDGGMTAGEPIYGSWDTDGGDRWTSAAR